MRASRRDLQQTHGDFTLFWFQADRAEFQARQGDNGYLWDLQGFYGNTTEKLWFKSEGEGAFGERIEDLEIQALYSRAIAPFFDLQAGIRQDLAGGLAPGGEWALVHGQLQRAAVLPQDHTAQRVKGAVGCRIRETGMNLGLADRHTKHGQCKRFVVLALMLRQQWQRPHHSICIRDGVEKSGCGCCGSRRGWRCCSTCRRPMRC